MVASSSSVKALVLGGIFLSSAAYFHAENRKGPDHGNLPVLSHHSFQRPKLAGFALPALDVGNGATILSAHPDNMMIIPPRVDPPQRSLPSSHTLFGGVALGAAINFELRAWAEPIADTNFRLPTDQREVHLAALAMPELRLIDETPLRGLSEEDDSRIVIRGASAVAVASMGTGAPSLPLSDEPLRVISGAAKGFAPANAPHLDMGKPPSAALAGANPEAGADDSPALKLAFVGEDRAKQQKCLADAVYWEARSEPRNGQIAVAQVVVNRSLSGFYPKDLCGVVYQNAHRYLSCQFTFACEGRANLIPTETAYWDKAQEIAADMLEGKIWLKEVGNATHYHAEYVKPWWARKMNRIRTIGAHIFYRPRNWS